MIRLARTLRTVVLFCLLLVVGGAAWIVGTTAGTRWFLDAVSRNTPAKISIRTVEGRLLDRLSLAGIRIGLTEKTLEIDRFVLDWQFFPLVLGRIDIHVLAMEGIRIRDNGPRAPLSLEWPRLPDAALFFTAQIWRLTLKDLTYRKLDGPPVIVDSFSASARWQGGHLHLTGIQTALPSARLEGKIDMGLRRPSLTADLAGHPKTPIGGLAHIFFQTRLKPGKMPEQAAGSFTLTGSGKTDRDRQRLTLSSEAGVTRKALHLRSLRFTDKELGGTITGGAAIDFSTLEPSLTLNLRAAGIDLTPQINLKTHLAGTLAFTGTTQKYGGSFTLVNTGPAWRSVRFSGAYTGNIDGLDLTGLTGTVLSGTAGGNLKIGWRGGLRVSGALQGRRLNPEGITPDWKGLVNFTLAGHLLRTRDAPLRGDIRGTLLESRLHGQALTGDVRGAFAGDVVSIESLNLRGKGFQVRAAGELDKKLALAAKIDDLSGIVPGTSGTLRADGWIRRHRGRLSGDIHGQGRTLKVENLRIAAADLAGRFGPEKDDPLQVDATLRGVAYNHLQADAVTLEAKGTSLRHTIHGTLYAPGAEARLELAGGYGDGGWRGRILRFTGKDRVGPWNLTAPADLALGGNGMTLRTFVLTGMASERLEAAADLVRPGLHGSVSVRAGGLNLARLDPWLKNVRITGTADSVVRLDLTGADRFTVAAQTKAGGTLDLEGRRITILQLDAALQGTEKGLTGSLEMRLPDNGELKGSLACAFPSQAFVPDRGDIKVNWSNLNYSLFTPWLPGHIVMKGRLAGGFTGVIHPAYRFELTGTTSLVQGTIRGTREAKNISARIDRADISWSWRDNALNGAATLALAEYGQARGRFQLPIPARFPVAADPRGPIEATLTGQLREKGLLTALFPGALQESQGNIEADITVTGRWTDPQLAGKLHLTKAGAYLPSAGIRLQDVELAGHFEKDALRIDTFRAVSGDGHLQGTGLIRLKEWHVEDYRISLTGNQFRTVYFPELQLYASPRLTFEGTPKKLTVRGEVHLPEVLVTGSPVRDVVAPSPDVVIEGRAPAETKDFPLDLDMQIRVTVGARVFVKLAGIDAQLGGAVELTARHDLDHITSTGEIKVVKGRYKTYGVTLEIVRGRLFYAGFPIDKPALDILALRTVGTVKAGVTVGGTLQAPVIHLYAEPPMQDVDILSYIVVGHPLGGAGEQADLLTMAAGALLSAGQSVVLQDKITKHLGLSSLEIQTRGKSTSAWDAYTAGPLTSTGTAMAASGSDVTQTMLTVGKYLTPKLYISYGRSLFTGSNQFLLRYDLRKNWQVETQTGSESGVDLYYKIEFK